MNPAILGALLCALVAAAVVVEREDPLASGTPEMKRPGALRPVAGPAMPPAEPPSLAEEARLALAELETPPLRQSSQEIAPFSRDDIAGLGPIAVGLPHRGALLNAVQMPAGRGYELVDPAHAWGTLETVLYLRAALSEMQRTDPDAPLLYVGQLSGKSGGWLKRHKSHQTGRDVDVGLYYRDGSHWYLNATPENLDVSRTFRLVQMLVSTEQIEYIFADRLIISLLEKAASERGLDGAERDRIFYDRATAPEGALRHAYAHRSHFHVRFKSPRAEERGSKLLQQLIRLRLVPARRYY